VVLEGGEHGGVRFGMIAVEPAEAVFCNVRPDRETRNYYHEFFHFVAPRGVALGYTPERYAQLNPPGTRYFGTSREFRLSNRGNAPLDPTDRIPGFVTGYAQANPDEDMAEVFGLMMADPAWMAARCRGDPVIAAKAAFVRQLAQAVVPDLDQDFWRRRDGAREQP